MGQKRLHKQELSAVSAAFVENSAFLKKFLSKYFSSQHDIEDVAQEAYLRAFAEEQKKGVRSPKAFLFHVAKNVALSKLTRKSRQITDYLEDLPSADSFGTEASADEHFEAEEMLGLYCQALATLPEPCRQAFILRKVHGLSHKEIAARMSVSASSVDKYLRRGLLTCEAYLSKHQQPSVESLKTEKGQTVRREK